jgi:hypothetical protein
MRQRLVKPFSAAGVVLLLGLATVCHAQQPGTLHEQGQGLGAPAEVRPAPVIADEGSEAIPPWGRELIEPSAPAVPLDPPAAQSNGPRLWLNVEYLLWWTRNGSAPPLVTRGDTSDPRPGALAQQYTKVLYGGIANDINFQDRHGGRFTFGKPLDGDDSYAVEASYLFLTARATGKGFASPGSPVLAQPFFDVLTSTYDSSLVTYPGAIQGSISVRSTSFLQGGECNGTAALWQGESGRVALLAGFRYLSLHEDLQINAVSEGVAPPFAGTYFIVQDRFATWSDFYGGQVGMSAELRYRRLQLGLLAKVAVGDTHDLSQVTGRTLTNFPAPLSAPAGFLALSSNSGRFGHNAFTVVPEVGATFGLRITERLTLQAGYTFLYWSHAARPGSQVDLGLNPHLIPTSTTFGVPGGPARPAAGVNGTDFWAQGASAGLLLRY